MLVIVPIRNRIQFVAPLLISCPFDVLIVEHSDDPTCSEFASNNVFYKWIDAKGQPFNKCLCFNEGVLASHKAEVYMLHDVDILMNRTKVDLYLGEHDAVQSFKARRLLQADHVLTQMIISGDITLNNIYEGMPHTTPCAPGAPGGSITITRDLFLKVGGFDEQYTEYSLEDQMFWDKINIMGRVGSADNEMLHLHHDFTGRQIKPQDERAYEEWKAMAVDSKIAYINRQFRELKSRL